MKLEDYTMSQVTAYIVDKVAKDFNIKKAEAKKLVINALLYNVVVEAIEEQVDYLIERED